ncbi:MAG: hypothetical protein A3C93_03855 [Candidatus Lloydbacteria bacterium RIFCSPHIGHO2_02_FULL_54_17]|uniref:SHS2 domain-containing protein n=1 Tax=Candidatus Lloydbacteria bacterium RIFCSPHIGHO2_02_FULL_54_17 TaxID=1798664 RepID=A0A1G2DJM3_9BACT|nr:MAG: hypothetical protein A2762_00265 [Candidatus Lloydbacteria bacterium RIFCSPHIGHO2_01_FULL_54_11]OGZ13008.1 MAG: hypothetical protein A3C93_03855 [Candidatus Lloydbacteria bacterium RIFCSPHIGHO2_02_FULL_54_17]OGZ15109.1 MAG: hypothetical protein A3H76_00410 [Candidatus Lloydbacteria bacterium RIFCSPLOWO2_02_FULL_54_12]OGZ15243.1 MAG: hypothetical protein A2948_05535 [Candidatus Lloydbacteria bacterium RIFCSPLOWO2_01_FULL_54_18]
MSAVGLDVSADAVRFIELEPGKGGLVVSRYATRNIPEGVITGGHVGDKKKLKEAIALLAREHKLSFANISLPEEQGYLANMRIPRVSPKELHDAIEIRLEEHIPIPAADAVFDYTVVDDPATRRSGMIDVVVSALPKAIVLDYLEIFHDTGVIPKAFEFESGAMARAVVPKGDKGTFLVADVGKMMTDVFVVAGGVVQFSASLDIGGHYLTQAIERALHVSCEEAEMLKVKHGLVGEEKDKAVRAAILPTMLDLRARLLRHYSYWQTHHGEKAGGNIECVYITGGGANLRGIEEYLAIGLDVRVVTANPWVNVNSFENYVPELKLREAYGYTAAIGLALRNTAAFT